MDEALLAVVHLLVIGCWLGTDLAVFFLSGRVVDPAQPMSVRRFCANAMSWLDMLPRTALVLTLASGLAMSMSLQFLPDRHAGAELVWLGSAVWLLLVWAEYAQRRGRWHAGLAGMDAAIRLVVVGACIGLAAALWRSAPWLSAKLAIMALIIALGLIIRWRLRPFSALFAQISNGAGGEQDQARLARLLARVKLPVLLIWTLLLVAAVLGRTRYALGAG
ncbi:MAG: hypothetical protein H7A19_15105 [Rhodanobacteraceae bacterium]|nr:hypothetical protein [Rhodanobacteraceae bacterium]